MKIHDEERDIYGTVYVQGHEYYLLESRPTRRELWMPEGTVRWLAADCGEFSLERNHEVEVGQEKDYVLIGYASYVVFDSSALIDLLPVPVTKKVIRFYVTDDEEA